MKTNRFRNLNFSACIMIYLTGIWSKTLLFIFFLLILKLVRNIREHFHLPRLNLEQRFDLFL
jgi:hypothetical protein